VEAVVSFEAKKDDKGVVKEVAVLLNEEIVLVEASIVPPKKEGTVTLIVDTTVFPDGSHVLNAAARQGAHVGWSIPVAVTVDNTPPQAIDLAMGIAVSDAVSVRWMAPGDVQPDGSVVSITSLEARVSLSPFDVDSWESADLVPSNLLPDFTVPGQDQELILNELANNTTYYVGLKATDEAGNATVSNVVGVATTGDVRSVYGSITEATTLDAGTYWVTDALVVRPRARLECGPDVVLKMNGRASITVEKGGRGIFVGEPEHPFVVTSENDDTRGILLFGSNGAAEAGDYVSGLDLTQDSQVRFITVAYAGEFALRCPAGTNVRDSEIHRIEETGIMITDEGEEIYGQTVKNLLIANVEWGILVDGQEELQWLTFWECKGALRVGPVARANVKECIFAHCNIGITLDNGAEVLGWNNGFYKCESWIVGEGNGKGYNEKGSDYYADISETPFATDKEGKEIYLLSYESPFLDHGELSAAKEGYLGYTNRLAPVLPYSKGRFMDTGRSDLGWKQPVDTKTKYLIHEGAVLTREVWKSGWTVVLTPAFVGIPQGMPEGTEATLVIEPGCVVKIAPSVAIEKTQISTVSVVSEPLKTGSTYPQNMEELMERLREIPGISVGVKDQSSQEEDVQMLGTMSLIEEGSGTQQILQSDEQVNYGTLLCVGTSTRPILITTVYDDDTPGVDTDGDNEPWEEQDPTESMPFYGLGFSYKGYGASSRVEHTQIRYAETGLAMLQKLGSPIQHNRFINCGMGIMDFAASMEDGWGRPQIIRNNLFSNREVLQHPDGIGVYSVSWYAPGGMVCSNTFDYLGKAIVAKGFFGLQDEVATWGQIESNLFTDCLMGISTINPDLGRQIRANGFYEVGTVIDWPQTPSSWFEEGWNISLASSPYSSDKHFLDPASLAVDGDKLHTAWAAGMGGMTTQEDLMTPDTGYLDLGYHRVCDFQGMGSAGNLAGTVFSERLTFQWDVPGGTWEEVTFHWENWTTTLRDDQANWESGSLVGLTVQPNVERKREFLIKANTQNTLEVYGDVTGQWVGEEAIAQACLPGAMDCDRYEIHDYRLPSGAFAVDKGVSDHLIEEDVDIDGKARVVDGDEDGTSRPDLGAHEVKATGQASIYVPQQIPEVAHVVYVDGSVTESGDGTSWDQAVQTVNEGIAWARDLEKPVRIWVAGGQYDENIEVGEFVQVFGGFAGTEGSLEERNLDLLFTNNLTTLRGNGLDSVVKLSSNTILDGFYVTGGMGHLGELAGEPVRIGGGISAIGGSTTPLEKVRVSLCRVQDNEVSQTRATGGGISFWNVNDGEILDCWIRKNQSSDEGGGVFIYQGQVSVVNCEIHGNRADKGAGVTLYETGQGTLFQGNKVTCNWALDRGGGLRAFTDSICRVERCWIAGNRALSGAGVFVMQSLEDLQIRSNWIVGNWASSSAGGMHCAAGRAISNMVIGNAAMYGGALVLYKFSGEVLNNTVARNESLSSSGAVILHKDVTGRLENNLFLDNQGYAVYEYTRESDAWVSYNGFYTTDNKYYIDEGGFKLLSITSVNSLLEAYENMDVLPELAQVISDSRMSIRVSYSEDGYEESLTGAMVPVGENKSWGMGILDDGKTYYVTLWVSMDGGQTWEPVDQTQITALDRTAPSAPTVTSVTPQGNGWVGGDVTFLGSCSADTMFLELEITDKKSQMTSWAEATKTGPTTWRADVGLFPYENEIRFIAYDGAMNPAWYTGTYWSDQQAPRIEIVVPR